MPLKRKLTNKIIENLTRDIRVIWDADVQGLHVRVLKSGKYFYLYYRNKYGDQRKPSLGRYGTICLNQARIKARDWWHIINEGGDPSLLKMEYKQNENATMLDLKIIHS